MMRHRTDPYSYLALALPGVVVGVGLVFLTGFLFLDRWFETDAATPDAAHAAIQGRVEGADWVASAAPTGPRLYLRLHIEEDSRSFIVSVRTLSERGCDALGVLDRSRARAGTDIPGLIGRSADIVVDSTLRETPAQATPYVSALRVSGTVLVPLAGREGDAVSPRRRGVLLLLLGLGTLLGLGIFGASVHHVAVCVRYWRAEP